MTITIADIEKRMTAIHELLGDGPREDWMRPLEDEFTFHRGQLSILQSQERSASAQAFIDGQANAERRYEQDGGVYIIRDRWILDATRPAGYRLDRCEYAVKGEDGSKVWKPCIEGVKFADIEPFETAGDA